MTLAIAAKDIRGELRSRTALLSALVFAALVLVVFSAVIIAFTYRVWDMNGAAFKVDLIEALEYLSIIGGLLLVFAVGSGPGAMDRTGCPSCRPAL